MKNAITALGLLAIATAAGPAAGQELPEFDSGLYLSVRGVGTNPTAKDAPSQVEYEFNYGYGGIAAIGYAVATPGYGVNFRFEIEGSYRRHKLDTVYDPLLALCGGGLTSCLGTGNFNVAAGMANVYFDFNPGSRVLPTVGFGYGRARYFFDDWVVNGISYPNFHTDTDVFQAMLGIGYKLSPGLILDTEFRYLQPNDVDMSGYFSNELTVGLRLIL